MRSFGLVSGLVYIGHTINMLFSVRHLLALTSLTGLLNLLYLMNYVDMKGNLEHTSSVFRRQIASVQNDADTKPTGPSLSFLELLNLDLKDLVERYMASSATIAKHYVSHNLASHDPNQDHERSSNGTFLPYCSPSPFLLILVHSSPVNFMDRESIRLSWGREDNPINQGSWTSPERSWKTIFLIGKSNNSKLNKLINQEAQVHRDIVIGEFLDSFRNLSLKTLLGLQWTLKHCQPKYILKTDEDCFINVLSLVQWLQDYHVTNGSKPLYAGKIQRNMRVVREKSHRYYVPFKHFRSTVFPAYASGGGYVFSASLLPELLEAASDIPLIPVEDACFGLYMQRIGVKPTNNLRFLPFVFCDNSQSTLGERPICHFRDPLVIHGIRDILHIQTHYNVLLMTFIPTICSYVDNQSFGKDLQTLC